MKRKVLLLGRAGIGKSSIKKVLFEGVQPKVLIDNPLEPTRDISPQSYTWLDLDLGIFDTSGQELTHLFKNKQEQDIAFKKADIVVYIFDYPFWKEMKTSVFEDIEKIKEIIKDFYNNTRLVLILHKIDLIDQELQEDVIKTIKEQITKGVGLPFYLTSLYPQLIYSTYNAFYQILSTFSEETYNLKIILDNKINTLSKSICYVTDNNNSIVVQSMTKDFNVDLINFSHNLTAQLNLLYEDMMSDDRIEHVIITSSNNLNLIMKNLRIKRYNLKNIVFISQSLTANKLIWLIGELRRTYNQFIFQGSYKLDGKEI